MIPYIKSLKNLVDKSDDKTILNKSKHKVQTKQSTTYVIVSFS